MQTENTIIVGGGPAGLAAALYMARADLMPLVIAGSPPGGQLTLTSEVENYPGVDTILGPELVEKMRAQAKKFEARFVDDNVKSVDFSKKPFNFMLSSGDVLQSKTAILATGASALWLGLENETKLRGRGVSACATCDGFFFKNKEVVVVGGGDTAMEEALTLTMFASKVYIVHRRDSFRASKIMQQRVFNNKKIEIIWNTSVVDVIGQERVEGVKIKMNDGSEKTLDVQGMFLAIGHKPNTEFLKDSGIQLNKKGYIVTSGWFAWEKLKDNVAEMKFTNFDRVFQHMTSVDGVFAGGDCVDYLYRQAATAVGMGVAAALETERYLAEK